MHERPGLRERKKERTRELIAATALELFAAQGFHATTVAEIAAAADVSERTVFAYFPKKEDILFADQLALAHELAGALEARREGVSALDALRAFAVDNLGRFDQQARIRRQVVRGDDLEPARKRARQAAFGEVVACAVAADLGERPADLRPQLVTATVLAALGAVFERRPGGRSRAQAVAAIDTAIAFLRGGIAATERVRASAPRRGTGSARRA